MGSSSTTNSSQNSNSNFSNTASSAPSWQPQVNALTTAFNQAGGALSNAQSYTAPTGTAANLNGNGALSNNGVNLSNNGTNAAASGLDSLVNYNASGTNNPSMLIDSAKQFVAGQNIPAQVKAAMQNATETARDVTLPGIGQNAAIGGNADSSRRGIAEGLVQRGLAEQSANLENAMTGQAFGQGLSLAQTQANNNNGLNLNAANAAAGQGNSVANTGSNVYSGALNNTGTANNINQSNYNNNVGNAYAALMPYMQLFGGTNWGTTHTTNGSTQTQGTGTQTTQNDPGPMSTISSGLGLLGAFL